MKTREELITENLNLVKWVCNKYIKPGSYMYDDCVSEGILGLCIAAELFDETKGFAFSTFAVPCIRNKVYMFVRDNLHIVKIPRRLIYLNHKILSLEDAGLSEKDICDKLDITRSEYSEALRCFETESLNIQLNDEDDKELIDIIPDVDEPNVEELEEYILSMVQETIAKEPEYIQEMYKEYMMSKMWDEPVSQSYLGNKYDKSQPQVGRILRRLDAKFKELFYRR